jgi:hypothetical protein
LKSDNKNAQDKLKLLYILDYIEMPLTNIEITNYILEYGMMDYFTLQLLLSDLCDVKFTLLKPYNGNEYYSVSKSGKAALEMFSDKLPEYFINEVEKNFSGIKKHVKKQREIFGHYYKRKDDEYIVSLQVTENSTTIFNISINVTDEITAKNIIKKWETSPEKIFGQIINALTN